MSACAASRKHEGHKQPLMPPASGGKGIGTRKVSLAHQHSPSFEGEQSNSLPQGEGRIAPALQPTRTAVSALR